MSISLSSVPAVVSFPVRVPYVFHHTDSQVCSILGTRHTVETTDDMQPSGPYHISGPGVADDPVERWSCLHTVAQVFAFAATARPQMSHAVTNNCSSLLHVDAFILTASPCLANKTTPPRLLLVLCVPLIWSDQSVATLNMSLVETVKGLTNVSYSNILNATPEIRELTEKRRHTMHTFSVRTRRNLLLVLLRKTDDLARHGLLVLPPGQHAHHLSHDRSRVVPPSRTVFSRRAEPHWYVTRPRHLPTALGKAHHQPDLPSRPRALQHPHRRLGPVNPRHAPPGPRRRGSTPRLPRRLLPVLPQRFQPVQETLRAGRGADHAVPPRRDRGGGVPALEAGEPSYGCDGYWGLWECGVDCVGGFGIGVWVEGW